MTRCPPKSFHVAGFCVARAGKRARGRRRHDRGDGIRRLQEIQQLVTTLKVFDAIEGCRSPHAQAGLADLSDALKERVRRYGDQDGFVSFLSFLAKAIDAAGQV